MAPVNSARVLCVCPDPLLRSTRQLVFSLRFVTVSIASVAEMLRLAQERFDAVVLCHSLAPQDSETAVQVALSQWPNAEIIVLARLENSCAYSGDTVVRTSAGPEFLLDSVDQLLQTHSRKQASPDWVQLPHALRRVAGRA